MTLRIQMPLAFFFPACITFLVFVFSLADTSAMAQQADPATGSINGTVTDPQGAGMPQAEVTVTSRNGTLQTAQVDSQGHYVANRLAPGVYSIDAQARAFARCTKTPSPLRAALFSISTSP